MLQFKNETGFEGTIYVCPDPAGVESLYTIVKGTFTLAEQVAPAEEQIPVKMEDENYGDAAETSISVPADFSLMKPGTDLVLIGTARAPGEVPTTQMDVSVAVGQNHKTVRVIGDRHWESAGVGYAISAPQPFTSMPLVWERAFGGTDRVGTESCAEIRNPVGTGFRAPDGDKPLDGLRLPNLEAPNNLIGGWRDTPEPACFAPVSPHWEPRRSLAGTYDLEWQRNRAPYLPTDFDPRFFQIAADGMVVDGHLEGGESVEIVGATHSGPLRFRLPSVNVHVTYQLDDSEEDPPTVLDTVLVLPDATRLILVWRTVFTCDKKTLRVREVRASLNHGN
jgi:hypothetical protein